MNTYEQDKLNKMNKPKEFRAEYLRDVNPNPFIFNEVPGINAPQLEQNISIQT